MLTAKRALVLGDGDGRFTQRLLQSNPSVIVHAVDSSKAMLHQLLCRAGSHASRVRMEHIDARLWRPGDEHYDLVVTHFFLDCFSTSEVEQLISRVHGATDEKTLWVISDFHVSDSLFGRLVALPIVNSLYLGFRILTGLGARKLPEYHPALQEAGFACRQHRSVLGGLLIAECWQQASD